MKVSLNWLKEYVEIEMAPEALGELLTMIGLEVEEIVPVGQNLRDILVARVLSIRPHPEADRLLLCRVDTGREQVQVVCGAPNLEPGALVPMALPGVELPDGTVISESRIRGESSTGMLLAEDELGLTDDHSGIMILPSDLAPGSSLTSALPIEDWVLDVNLTPNRGDCACVLGIAREIAAATGKRLRRPEIQLKEEGPPIEELTSVTLVDPKGCPRYAAGVIQDVHLDPSPFWMRYRLHLSDTRGINNLVDVTNYVMLEMGQPLHAFDYDRLRENRIVVRRAQEGEMFTTLDGQTHHLNDEVLMICDGERAVALAGIMGGLNSEIFAGTKNVLLESAFFDPVTIRRGSKYMGLSTEASYRFERGADIGGTTNALRRAISLLCRLAGGRAAKGVIDNYPKVFSRPVIDLDVKKTRRLLGNYVPRDAVRRHLESLEMEVQEVDEQTLKATPPSFRVDITRDVDLMEEVARLEGYERIPVTSPRIGVNEEGDPPELALRDHVKQIMTGLGFTEIITYSFVSPESADMLGAEENSPLRRFVKLLNPLTGEQSVMRTSLVPGLLSTAKTNLLYDERALRLFEWGKVYLAREGDHLPLEKDFLGALICGLYHPKTWYLEERSTDFYDMKGAAEALLKALLRDTFSFKRIAAPPGYDPDLTAGICCSGDLIGQVGRVSPRVIASFDLAEKNVYVMEIEIDALLKGMSATRKFQPFAKFPAVHRDISMVVPREVESAKITSIIRREGGDLIESVEVFDLYQGEKIGFSEKSLGLRICYRSKTRTLDGGEINLLHETIIDRIKKETGGRLREA